MKYFDDLNIDEIKSRLKNLNVYYYPIIDSTNLQAKRLIDNSNNDNLLIICNEQTDGRGRQGKSFYSPANTGVYMSIVIHPMKKLTDAVAITTLTSVAVCKALEKVVGKKFQIKWVNDIYCDDKKVCGILTQAVSDYSTQTVTSMIIGIGVNVSTCDFPDYVENAVGLGSDVKRIDIICEIAKEILKIQDSSLNEHIDYYKSHSMIIDKKINYTENGTTVSATAVDIDDLGGLCVVLENGQEKILRSGEITVRKV